MTVYFNAARGRWMYDFRRSCRRFAGYCNAIDGTPANSRRAALQAEARAKAAAEIAPKLARAGDYTLAQAFAALLPSWQRQDDWMNKRRACRELLEFFGRDVAMADIGAAEIRAYTDFSAGQAKRVWCGGPHRDAADPKNARYWKTGKGTRGPATVNLYLNVLRLAVNHAASVRDQITGEPAIRTPLVVKDLEVPKRRARPVPDAVLMEALASVPQHTKEAITLTLLFGFRKTEVFGLTIAHADFQMGGVNLAAADVKNDTDSFMHGGPEAMAFLAHLVEQATARGVKHLITWQRHRKDPSLQAKEPWQSLKSSRRAWTTAMDSIETRFGRRWRWHDIRAAFITHIALTSGPVAAQALARHARYETTAGYVDVADNVRRQAASRAADRPALALISGGQSHKRQSQTASHGLAGAAAKSL